MQTATNTSNYNFVGAMALVASASVPMWTNIAVENNIEPLILEAASNSRLDAKQASRASFNVALEDVKESIALDYRDDLINTFTNALNLQEDWDGHGGCAPSKNTVANASLFVRLLPLGICVPEPTIAGDGEVGVYWKNAKTFIDVSFYDDGNIVYFASNAEGQEVASGDRYFSGKAIPRDLMSAIESFNA